MKYLFALLLSLSTLPSLAAQKDTPGAWFGLFHRKDLSEKFSMWGDYQLRYTMEKGEMQQTLFRFGPLWRFARNQEIGLLYGFVEFGVKEYRTTLHHLIHATPRLLLRSRLEYRNLEHNDDDSLRFRYLIRYLTPFRGSTSFLVWEEPFFNLTSDSWTDERTFDRNRIFLGFRFPAFGMEIEAGYMNQFIPRSTRDTMEHLALVYVYY